MKCYLIAKKLSHSYSKLIHNALAPYSYEYKELSENELSEFFEKKDFDALNITIPYKETVLKYLDFVSPEAQQIGAVNTVVNDGGRLLGYNTDCYGFRHQLSEASAEILGKDVVILGRGGAAKTVEYVCRDMGASRVRMLTRQHSDHLPFYDAQVVINATPAGMYPNNGECAIDITKFTNCMAVLDLVYNPSKTKLILDAERMGIKTAGGLSMLVAQAKKAAEIFTGNDIADEKISEVKKLIELHTKNIILIGMPGCGKSTVGKILAENMEKEFFDSDEEIAQLGKTPEEIIKSEGEGAFRKIETKVLEDLTKKSGTVIATGGGCVTVRENFDLLRQNATIVFIERDINTLSAEGRPLSMKGIEGLWQLREPLYRELSDITVNSQETPLKTAQKILEVIL